MYNYTYNNTTLYFPNTAAEIYVRKFVLVDNVKSLDNKSFNDSSLGRQVNFVSVKVIYPGRFAMTILIVTQRFDIVLNCYNIAVFR